ncbi:similar to Saccharomyces cerevisiae YHR137W ARO9 Aromatic aminotransferase II, catalyzes the first step of tryptophan, phenylalanine, and tyrosine catabolism [Maudiozyma barnettii]|uniref:Similar to Saccharomyces cerevisiae YHR137W ARO9 Aromatic aminotransferase II, catalyzes the first step of tryptophan, phenylalanine, and tyrosine catabolism n=1 Tax=Maudiozyma barnettii TaxID=61262 RepID=A0A8H2VHR1_9SACH|nr:aromatic-amino-acid:2-oxoglutarate transaminase [Kazachstania barnettii]CAB4255645.1 similar to Saccharomyces cerevisiae YHR137W ARO9 Aromatic aminotransferase II, catalyzes the first step of tryptophan, phenylalanine, and tyrosine catabolism [Kazachstania barnettii]CAD1784206.1 similar to Saccharomyces cerevisiae YHR137W ARO9 Aromatic aminotransferase II, catalyzes the first step of tryptophan, phenylalanine, and tyrosine catabolism [Kazachstania barnettii]
MTAQTPKTYDDLKDAFQSFISRRDKDRHMNIFWETNPSKFDNGNQSLIELSGGMPHESFFPIESINLNILKEPVSNDTIAALVTKEKPAALPLARTLQYSLSEGFPPLIEFVKRFITKLNNIPLYDTNLWKVVLAGGSCDSLFKIFETCTDENSTVMVEELTFVPVVSNIINTGAKVIPLKLNLNNDDEGIDLNYMESLLSNWETGPYKHLNRPKFLYTIPTGQNPTGLTQSVEKRRKIYKLAQRFNFIILEDDPYGYLKFPKYNHENPLENPYKDDQSITSEEYIKNTLMKSYISMDTDGRVIRFETFSKIFAPGMRLSFVIMNNFFYDKFLKFQEISTRQPSGISQQIVYSTIHSMTSSNYNNDVIESWLQWIMKLACNYTERRNVMLQTLYESESFNKAQFSVVEPSAGMFIIIKVNFNEAKGDIISQMGKLFNLMDSNGVRAILGYKMAFDQEFSKDHLNFFRLTYAYADGNNQIKEAISRINKSLLEYFE